MTAFLITAHGVASDRRPPSDVTITWEPRVQVHLTLDSSFRRNAKLNFRGLLGASLLFLS